MVDFKKIMLNFSNLENNMIMIDVSQWLYVLNGVLVLTKANIFEFLQLLVKNTILTNTLE